ncbi:hypothetical protein GPM19_13265 [Halomonas sp. ZH2S]|uniref:Uncharacterized protein n=1 Tax=Vreelandella zhuhanensis TaxID=2684210 RepID=A0A7X3H2H6_9GAMM|nr:hypothetical protein [Halomonas zhuhanensis]MWJ29151.1 hypothetical protein [Halomonas zhuhanensis]
MKVVHVKAVKLREACLARLCAEVYGRQAGLTPLVIFAGTRRVLFAQEAARLLALVDNQGAPQALALLVLDEAGEGMTVQLSCSLNNDIEARRQLIKELSLKAPLRVEVQDPADEAFYQSCGLTRWFDGPDNQRIGLGARHPASDISELSDTLSIDEQAILRSFKHDAKSFEEDKQRFVEGLAAFPETL